MIYRPTKMGEGGVFDEPMSKHMRGCGRETSPTRSITTSTTSAIPTLTHGRAKWMARRVVCMGLDPRQHTRRIPTIGAHREVAQTRCTLGVHRDKITIMIINITTMIPHAMAVTMMMVMVVMMISVLKDWRGRLRVSGDELHILMMLTNHLLTI